MTKLGFIDDFKDVISKSTLRNVGIGLSAMLLMGCQMTQNTTSELEYNKIAQEETSIVNTSGLETVNKSNYQDILKNQLSGVYKHPIYDDQIITLKFTTDNNSDSNINNALNKIGMSSSGYETEKFLHSLVKTDDGSRHIQNMFGNKSNDVNLCIINPEDYEVKIEDFKVGQIKALTNQNIESINKDELYNGYYLIMHEIGHSMQHQQIGVLDLITSPFSKSKYIELENSSEIYGTVKTIQLMNEKNESNQFIQNYTNERIDVALIAANKNKNDIHQILPTTQIIDDLFRTDPNYLLNLSDIGIAHLSNVISKEVVNYDYAKAYNEISIKRTEQKVNFAIESFANQDLDILNSTNKELAEKIKANSFRSKKTKDKMISLYELQNSVIDHYNDLNSILPEKVLKAKNSMVENLIPQRLNSLKLNDFNKKIIDIRGKSSSKNISELHMKIGNSLSESKTGFNYSQKMLDVAEMRYSILSTPINKKKDFEKPEENNRFSL